MADSVPVSPNLERLVWGGIGLAAGLLIGAYLHASWATLRPEGRRPQKPLPVLSTVTQFALTNQTGRMVTAADLAGHPWLGAIIFTRCPGPCVRVTRNLVRLQDGPAQGTDLRFVVLTADPEYDTPRTLQQYGERFGVDPRRWDFLTGTQFDLYTVATQQLLLAVAENPDPASAAPQDLFIHSTKVVLVDARGKVRAAYDGEDPGALIQAVADVNRLAEENP